jgi:DNA-binding winged helix-turn-helix (wHTH) protein
MRVRFGDCEFDSEAYELTRAGRRVEVTPKAFELLTALLEARPRALSKAELHDRVWPKTFVGNTSLPRLVNELRRAIGDDANDPRFLRTVSGVGYAFSAPAAEAEGPSGAPWRSAWSLTWNGEETPLREGENVLGRDLDADLQIASTKVSRRHARIVVTGETAIVEDLGSKNGTFVDGRKIDAATAIGEGSEVGVGPALLVFRAATHATSTATERGEGSRRNSARLRLAAAPGRTRSKP